MATVADVVLTGTAYQNLNAESGLITGTPLAIQNKGSSSIRIIISSTQPDASSVNGQVVPALGYLYVENETEVVWSKSLVTGNTRVSVQQLV